MHIAIVGASGGTGRQLVQQALDAGHRVIAVVRDPSRLPIEHPALDTVIADVTKADSVRPAVEGRDAVLSTLGPHGRKSGGFVTTAVRAILPALEATGVSRFVAVSAAPVGPEPEGDGLLLRMVVNPLVKRMFADVYADLGEMEEEIRRSTVEWTVMRPPRLTDKALRGTYRRTVGANSPNGRSISRADLAHAMLVSLDDRATVKQVVGVSY